MVDIWIAMVDLWIPPSILGLSFWCLGLYIWFQNTLEMPNRCNTCKKRLGNLAETVDHHRKEHVGVCLSILRPEWDSVREAYIYKKIYYNVRPSQDAPDVSYLDITEDTWDVTYCARYNTVVRQNTETVRNTNKIWQLGITTS